MTNLIHHRPFHLFRRGEPRSVAGQATVETALVLPALLVLLMGIIIAGFAFYAFIQVTNAAREGARAGSLYRITVATRPNGWTVDDEVKSAICNSSANTSALGYLKPASGCSSISFNVNNDVTVTYVDVNSDTFYSPGDQVTAQITYSYTLPIVSSFVRAIGNPMVIVRSVTMELQ
jgi:Flp pilus assembly protein TadG